MTLLASLADRTISKGIPLEKGANMKEGAVASPEIDPIHFNPFLPGNP